MHRRLNGPSIMPTGNATNISKENVKTYDFMKASIFVRKTATVTSIALLVLGGAGIVSGPAGLWLSPVERLTHFRFYWLGLLAALMVWWLARRAWRLLTAGMLLIIGGALPLLDYYHSPLNPEPVRAGPAPAVPALKVISFNVLSKNTRRGEVMEWLKAERADLILLTEFNWHWERALAKAGGSQWPHRIVCPRNGAAGICLLSRYPMESPDPEGIAENEPHPWISTLIHGPGGDFRVIGMHPRTPRGGFRFVQRNRQLDHAASMASASPLPVLLMGDLNCTPFSPWFSRLLKRGGLRDSGEGFGLPPTWRSGVWFLPIDHLLISKHWRTLDRCVHTGDLGSDHRPLIGLLALSPKQPLKSLFPLASRHRSDSCPESLSGR
ncbi:MAG: endonuclease/exonuclease/phosphatase family protein [Verrucomicrobiaceae bacterium]|nr:MAG: endonuclease/exonuclease/phosphatase family protein [Verrucomicrobiaceae bacterium]